MVSMADLPPGLADLMPNREASMAIIEHTDHIAQLGIFLAILAPIGDGPRCPRRVLLHKPSPQLFAADSIPCHEDSRSPLPDWDSYPDPADENVARPQPAYASRALVAPGLLGSLPSLAPDLPTSLPGLGLGLALSKPAGSGGAAIRIAWGLIALTNLLAWRMFPRQEGETYT